MIERGNVPVLLRRQPFEPSLARMHDERIDAGRDRGLGETIERFLRVLLVDAQSAFHGHRDRHDAFIAATQSPTRRGSRMRQAPKRPFCTRSEGQPTLRLISR